MFYVYIMANQRNGTIYTGQTDDLMNRVHEHKHEVFEGFTKQYNCKQLVWYELHETRASALLREKRIKKWDRDWKLKRIEAINPNWDDLSETITEADLYEPDKIYRRKPRSGSPPARG